MGRSAVRKVYFYYLIPQYYWLVAVGSNSPRQLVAWDTDLSAGPGLEPWPNAQHLGIGFACDTDMQTSPMLLEVGFAQCRNLVHVMMMVQASTLIHAPNMQLTSLLYPKSPCDQSRLNYSKYVMTCKCIIPS